MKNLKTLPFVVVVLFLIVMGCSMSTANMSSLKVGKDSNISTESSSFKPGDTIHANAVISNNPGKVKVKFYLNDSTGKTIPGSEVSVDLDGSGTATYTLPVPPAAPAGSYKLYADMINENGEKKDGKTADITVS